MENTLHKESYEIFCHLMRQNIRQNGDFHADLISDQDVMKQAEESMKNSIDSIARGGALLFNRLAQKEKKR